MQLTQKLSFAAQQHLEIYGSVMIRKNLKGEEEIVPLEDMQKMLDEENIKQTRDHIDRLLEMEKSIFSKLPDPSSINFFGRSSSAEIQSIEQSREMLKNLSKVAAFDYGQATISDVPFSIIDTTP